MDNLAFLKNRLRELASEYKQIVLSQQNAAVTFSTQEAQYYINIIRNFDKNISPKIASKENLTHQENSFVENLQTKLPTFIEKYANIPIAQQAQLQVYQEKAIKIQKLLQPFSATVPNVISKVISFLKQEFYLYEGDDNSLVGKYFTFDCIEPENILVINKEGAIVFDSGNHNGALYLMVGKVDISEISAAEIIKDTKNFKQLTKVRTITLKDGTSVCVGEWIGSQKELKQYLRSQANQVGFSKKIPIKIKTITGESVEHISHELQSNNPEFRNGMTLTWGDKTGKPVAENKRKLELNGILVDSDDPEVLKNAENFELLLNKLAKNPYELQNVLVHEAKHNEQANRMEKTGKKMTISEMEIEAIEAQMAHSTWDKTSDLFKKEVQYYLATFR